METSKICNWWPPTIRCQKVPMEFLEAIVSGILRSNNKRLSTQQIEDNIAKLKEKDQALELHSALCYGTNEELK